MEVANTNLFELTVFLQTIRVGILLVLLMYATFSLIIVRQVDLMGKTLITPVSPLVRSVAIIHAGFAIGFLVLIFGIL